jgi:hypothetical protein
MLPKFLRWLFGGIGGSLTPILIAYLLSGKLDDPNDAIKHGNYV